MDAIAAGKLGLGQIVVVSQIPTKRSLVEVGRDREGFWRTYAIEGPELYIKIYEYFPRKPYQALGWLEGHDDLRQRIEVRLESLNSIAGQQARAKLDAADDERDATRAEQEAKDAAKQERDDTRAAEIKEWAAEHGSTRLKAQIELGLDGWPLYLHERLTADWTPVTGPGTDDFASPELDNDGEHGVTLVNPSLLLAKAAKQIATRAVELGLAADIDDAIGSIEIVPIEFAIDSDDYSEEEMCERQEYVTFAGYRPGSEAFETKTIRFRCEE
ncbi:hypothetical protein LCGC14_1068890 [marine sediment metagenome]|uniref:Uncharacterized protein n=1 Tax=marine sediment metagenome TaxID=412755 RepID=A0A0F9MNN6_9ZZZZ